MSSSGTIPLKSIWSMLDHCAQGYTAQEGKHHWIVRFNGKTFRTLPLGPHGRRVNPPTQIGHVRNLVRFFEIEECAKRHIEALR